MNDNDMSNVCLLQQNAEHKMVPIVNVERVGGSMYPALAEKLFLPFFALHRHQKLLKYLSAETVITACLPQAHCLLPHRAQCQFVDKAC